MRVVNHFTLIVLSSISFISSFFLSMPARSRENKIDHEFIVYTFSRPPFSLAGTIDSDGNYYDFTNARPVECDLRLGNACFMKTSHTAKIITPGIIQVGNAYACAESLITKEREKTEHLTQFSYGYGICSQEGWVSQENS